MHSLKVGNCFIRRTHWRTGASLLALPSRRLSFDPWVEKIPWRRKWQTHPVLLPEKPHGQRSLLGYSPSIKSQTHLSDSTGTTPENLRPGASLSGSSKGLFRRGKGVARRK